MKNKSIPPLPKTTIYIDNFEKFNIKMASKYLKKYVKEKHMKKKKKVGKLNEKTKIYKPLKSKCKYK